MAATAPSNFITYETPLPGDATSDYVQYTSFVPPVAPQPGIYDIMNTYNSLDIRPYLDFLRTLTHIDTTLKPKDLEYKPLPPCPDLREMNFWLRSLLHMNTACHLFRNLRQPKKDEFSALARCIRFASSHAQQSLSWAVHPVHVALIVERTNFYGIERASAEKDEVKEGIDLEACQQLLVV